MAKLLTGTRIYGTGTVDTQLFVSGSNSATSTITGALQVVGGAGIGGALYVGNTATILNTANATSTITGALQVVGGVGIGGALYVGNTATILNTANATSTTTGALQVVGGAGIGGNLYVGGTITANITGVITTATSIAAGTAGQVPYQTGAGATSFFGPGTAGNVLVSNGTSAPSYNNTLTLAGTASASSTVTGAVQGVGGVGIGGGLYVGGSSTFTNSLTVAGSSAATSTATGALQVKAGAGIGGALYVGGNIYTNGTQVIPLSIQEFTATAAQTTFTFAGGYTVGTVQVFANGIQLGSGDLTASNGTTVILNEARKVGDVIRIIAGGTSTSVNNIRNFSIAMSVAMAM